MTHSPLQRKITRRDRVQTVHYSINGTKNKSNGHYDTKSKRKMSTYNLQWKHWKEVLPFNAALDGCQAPAALAPPKKPGTRCINRLGGPQGRSGRVRNISPPQPQCQSPVPLILTTQVPLHHRLFKTLRQDRLCMYNVTLWRVHATFTSFCRRTK